MPFKLSGLLLNRVDLVPDGANSDAHIMLFKSKEGRVPQKAKKKAAKSKADTRSKSKQRGDEDEEEDEDEDIIVKADDDEDDDDLDDDDDLADDEDDEEDDRPTKKSKSKAKKPAKKVAKKTKKVKKADDDEDEDDAIAEDDDDDVEDDEDNKRRRTAKSRDENDDDAIADDEDDDEDEDGIPSDVLKSLPKHVRARLEKQDQRYKELRKEVREASEIAKEERDKREKLEFVEKAKTTIPTLPGTHEEKGAVLKAIQKLDTEIRKRLVKLLKAGEAAMKSTLSESGRPSRDEDDDSPLTQLREEAEEIRKASKGSLTKEQAFEKACHANPTLFKQYRVEKRRTRDIDVM